ncbi:MAG TPA: ABC transporter ATP-binding protein [Acidimicrobiales bacterium]|nr:ABC transporter ATP-binding protein [Acidimicrobiales bacterium]
MNEPAIRVESASKRYVKYDDTPMLVTRLARLRSRTTRSPLWAVREVSFDAAQGEVLGVIGRNGSGKSTLLRMLAGVTAPTEGRVTVRGRVAPLIAVGVGFHQELTGRENVYINGTVLGLSRRQIDQRFDEVVEFAEIAEFIDTPVKFYSSGMFVRLGFAVSVAADPDVLIVDEVLSVGDIGFQMKCVDRMAQIQRSGATIVVVSHNMAAIRNLCQRTVVLHDGEVRHDGDTEQAISLYHRLLAEERDLDERDSHAAVHSSDRDFDLRANIERFDLLGPDGSPTRHLASSDEAVFVVEARFVAPVEGPLFGITVFSGSGVQVYGEATGWWDRKTYRPGDVLRATIRMRMCLASGTYSCSVGLATKEGVPVAPQAPPVILYVAGRNGVNGLTDLGAQFELAVDEGAWPPGRSN